PARSGRRARAGTRAGSAACGRGSRRRSSARTISARATLAYGARVTIRAKLAVAIALTVLGPVVTIGVALAAFGTLGDRFDDVRASGDRQGVALELKFAVTDMNGWQTAYGYDSGASRGRFVRAATSAQRQ